MSAVRAFDFRTLLALVLGSGSGSGSGSESVISLDDVEDVLELSLSWFGLFIDRRSGPESELELVSLDDDDPEDDVSLLSDGSEKVAELDPEVLDESWDEVSRFSLELYAGLSGRGSHIRRSS